MSDPRETLAALQDHVIDRRRFLAFTGALAGTALYAQMRGDAARARAAARLPVPARGRLGRPGADGACRSGPGWRPSRSRRAAGCRCATSPSAGSWRATTRFKKVERRGVVAALPELAHSVHVDVRGLEPGAGVLLPLLHRPDRSPVGRTRDRAEPGAKVEELTFAFASCQAWPDGFYSAYRRMDEQDLDLVVHLGDYIYEYGIPADGGARNVAVPPALQRVLRDAGALPAPARALQDRPGPAGVRTAASPGRSPGTTTRWRTTTPGIYPEYAETSPEFVAKRAAAYQAYFEHMPLRLRRGRRRASSSSTGGCATATSPSSTCSTRASTAPTSRAATASSRAATAGFDPAATMTGDAQEAWLLDGLRRRGRSGTCIAQGVMMGELKHDARRAAASGRTRGTATRASARGSSSRSRDQRGPGSTSTRSS